MSTWKQISDLIFYLFWFFFQHSLTTWNWKWLNALSTTTESTGRRLITEPHSRGHPEPQPQPVYAGYCYITAEESIWGHWTNHAASSMIHSLLSPTPLSYSAAAWNRLYTGKGECYCSSCKGKDRGFIGFWIGPNTRTLVLALITKL